LKKLRVFRAAFLFSRDMKQLALDDLEYAGFLSKPAGFKGEIVFATESLDPEDFKGYSFIFVAIDGLPVPFKVASTRIKSGQLILKLEDVDSESEAKTLNGKEVFLEGLPEGDESDQPSFDELEGYSVIDRDAGRLGVIQEIEELPMQYIARCDYGGKEVLIPMNESVVISIDPDRKEVHVVLPDGLLDVYTGANEDGDPDD
jgi:16S rRNA processing protein RimM